MTHCALFADTKYEEVLYQDFDTLPCLYLQNSINGEYLKEEYLQKIPTRKEFIEKKRIDPFITYCWSFGGDGVSWMGDDREGKKNNLDYSRGSLSRCNAFYEAPRKDKLTIKNLSYEQYEY